MMLAMILIAVRDRRRPSTDGVVWADRRPVGSRPA